MAQGPHGKVPQPDGMTAGLTLAVTVGLAVVAGVWLDRRFGLMPLCTILFTLGGIGMGGVWLYVRVLQPGQQDRDRRC